MYSLYDGTCNMRKIFFEVPSCFIKVCKYNIMLTIKPFCSFKEEENVRQDLASKGEQYLTS